MARVFVSYRRADGQYGVGWLAERLRSLDSITGVETAFHDSALRAGDDFPDALDREIAGSDLVIVVIGPEWLGDSGLGPSRIQDPDDWVVREIATAFRQGTRVMPILLGGAEHPFASQVHESIAEIARLHALPFSDGRDLDTIVDHVTSHLGEIDRERARRAGLEEPVTVPDLPRPSLLIATATLAGLAAAAGGVATWATDRCTGPCTGDQVGGTTAYSWFLVVTALMGALAAASSVVGLVIAHRLVTVMSHRWHQMVAVIAVVVVTIVSITISIPGGVYGFASADSLVGGDARFWSGVLGTCVPIVIWAFAGLSVRFGEPRAPAHQVGLRVRTLGIVRDAERWAVLCLTGISFLVASGSALVAVAIRDAGEEGAGSNPVPNLAHALFLVVLVFALHLATVPKLRGLQSEIERELVGLPQRYRDHAAPRLVAATFDDGGWGFRIVLGLPVLAAVIGAVALLASG